MSGTCGGCRGSRGPRTTVGPNIGNSTGGNRGPGGEWDMWGV